MIQIDDVKSVLTPEELNALNDQEIQLAIDQAVWQFSQVSPRPAVAMCDVLPTARGGQVTLPSDWVQGFSRVDRVDFPVTTSMPTTTDKQGMSFSWNESPKTLFTAPAMKGVLAMRVFIEEAFNAGATMSIGDAQNPQRLVLPSQIYPNEKGEYSISIGYTYPIDTPIILTITNATHGSGTVIYTIEP
jgi:hypothetical protein